MQDTKCPSCAVPISEHQSGMCLDRWVAEQVMQWKWYEGGAFVNGTREWPFCYTSPDRRGEHLRVYRQDADGWDVDGPWNPSRDLAAAWLVVEKMQERGNLFALSHDYPEHDKIWVASFSANGDWDGEAATAPHAICIASLLASAGKGEK